jgi:hypothetical protein
MTAIFPEQRVGIHDRLDQIRSLAPDQVEAGLAWLARNDPPIFDATMQAARTWDDGTAAVPDSEPYCVVCRGKVGLFAGQDGWRHYRGDEFTGIEQYPATHRAVIGWRPASVIR